MGGSTPGGGAQDKITLSHVTAEENILLYKSVKGMHDLIPPASKLWSKIEKTAQTLFESFGFQKIVTPIVEEADLFMRSVGETSEVVQKQMYVFKDKKDKTLCLRPEGTASVARAYVEHRLFHPEPYQKLYYWGPMYRYERMQQGRYRQHFQVGVEVFGSADPRIDAETIYVLSQFYQKLGISNFQTEINSIGDATCRPKFRDLLVSYFKKYEKDLSEDGKLLLERNPLRLFDSKEEAIQKICQSAPVITQHLCVPCKTHFEAVQRALTQLNVSYHVNPHIVRGLDYYCKTAFEIVSGGLGAQNALGAGGRYDGLVQSLGGPDIAAFGFATGIERLMLALEGTQEPGYDVDVFVCALGEKAQAFAFGLVNKMRMQNISTEVDYEDRALKKQMQKADRMNARYVLIVGDTEIEKGEAVLRNMKTKVQRDISFSNILEVLQREILK